MERLFHVALPAPRLSTSVCWQLLSSVPVRWLFCLTSESNQNDWGSVPLVSLQACSLKAGCFFFVTSTGQDHWKRWLWWYFQHFTIILKIVKKFDLLIRINCEVHQLRMKIWIRLLKNSQDDIAPAASWFIHWDQILFTRVRAWKGTLISVAHHCIWECNWPERYLWQMRWSQLRFSK